MRETVAESVSLALARTIRPMSVFLQRVEYETKCEKRHLAEQQVSPDGEREGGGLSASLWAGGEHNEEQEAVMKRLRSVHVYTPLDLRLRLQSQSDAAFNAELEYVGAVPFSQESMRLFRRLLLLQGQREGEGEDNDAPIKDCNSDPSVLSPTEGSMQAQLVRRVFLPNLPSQLVKGDATAALEAAVEECLQSPVGVDDQPNNPMRNPISNASSSSNTSSADTGVGATSSSLRPHFSCACVRGLVQNPKTGVVRHTGRDGDVLQGRCLTAMVKDECRCVLHLNLKRLALLWVVGT